MVAVRTFCVILTMILGANAAFAESLFGIVSERNSATAAAAAKQFKDAYPEADISLRTPRQVSLLTDADVIAKIRQSDVFFVAGVFSDDADRLQRLVETSGKTDNIYIVSSTQGLISLSRNRDGAPLAIDPATSGETVADGGGWRSANDYWQARGVANIANLFAALLYPDRMNEIAAPVPLAPVRFAERIGQPGAPTIALVDYETGDQAGNADLHDRLCEELVATGLACQSVFAGWGAASADALEHLSDMNVSGIVLLQDFAIGDSFLGRASNLYGLVDNNDAFDYLGGLNLAVESVRGRASKGYVVDVSDPDNPETSPLASAIVQELRARQLNPNWIKSLMPHGYAGARTMNVAFFENLWGWEATDPELFPDEIWEDAKDIYIDDRYALGLEAFFDEANNKPVKANILAIMLVAAHKGYWRADAETITKLAEKFAAAVIEAGLPGSGHTRPDHPMLDWLGDVLPEETSAKLTDVRNAARGPVMPEAAAPETIRELQARESSPNASTRSSWWTLIPAFLLVGVGVFLGRRSQV
ncbi:MAG: cobaltochelatase subunit CobN [Pseudomonadota bacterium]